jgi:sugar phosphate isomerase/epimerase
MGKRLHFMAWRPQAPLVPSIHKLSAVPASDTPAMTILLPISIQIYSLRNLGDLATQLDVVSAAGYRHVELIGSQLDNAAATLEALEARGLKASSSHVSMAALRERPTQVLAACKTLGFTQLFMPAVPPEERNSDGDYWLALGKELGDFAHRFAEEGISLGYHNHDWELQPKAGGANALERLFQGAEGAPLTWQMDVAWLVRGGADPLVWMKREAGRVVSLHAKDLAPKGEKLDEDGWADVGSGTLDWPTLARAGRDAGAQWLVAEHDKPNDPARFTRNSQAFLSHLGD